MISGPYKSEPIKEPKLKHIQRVCCERCGHTNKTLRKLEIEDVKFYFCIDCYQEAIRNLAVKSIEQRLIEAEEKEK